MAIATCNLQQNIAPQGADTLLMAESAGGTAQLTLANLAKFLTEQDNAVKTALSNKAHASAQQTVEKTGVSARTVELAAAELPAFIAAMPRLLTEHLTVKVSGTLTADTLWFSRFYGCGSIIVMAAADGDAVLKTEVKVSRCSIPIEFQNIRFQDPHPGSMERPRVGLMADKGSRVFAAGCSFSSTAGGANQNSGYTALWAESGSFVGSLGTRGISGCGCAALASQGGIIACACDGSAAAANMRDNGQGAYTYQGGIVQLGGAMPNTMGGVANHRTGGGLTISAGGTVLTA